MKRVRLLLGLVALGLAIPVGLLVHRSLESAEAEQRAREQAIADTAFAAVERELAAVLSREEQRAWDEWRHLRVPEGEVQGSEGLVRSPLADLPDEPFILGWFQVEPDGSIGSPLVPQDELAAVLALSSPSAEAVARDRQLREWIGDWLAARPARPVRPAPIQPELTLDEPAARVGRLDSLAAPSVEEALSLQDADSAAETSAKDNLRSRKEASEKKKSSYSAGRQEMATRGKAEVFQKGAESELVQNVMQRNDSQYVPLEPAPPQVAMEPEAEPEPELRSPGLQENEEDGAPSQIDVVVEAFSGELDAAGRLVLHRLVIVAGVPYRQGLVLDVAALADRVDPLELLARTAGTEGVFSLGARPTPSAGHARRLPAPFDPLHASLSLVAPDGMTGTRTVLALAGLLLVVGLTGLVAVDRMVGTNLAYAQRRSDFVSAVTHELKTPLAAIRLHGEMLQEGIAASEEKRADSYRTITAECERLTRLVDNVLELSRLEKGTRSVHLVAGPIEPVLSEAIDLLEPHARSAGFELDLEVEQGLAARFDRDALLQVVFNLVDNALKYAKEAEDKRVELIARRDGEQVALFVRDQGPGVPARHLRRIFEPFWRGERELTRRAKGTGIGLALVQGLVERMQGEVDGRNLEAGGFEVRITLPGATA